MQKVVPNSEEVDFQRQILNNNKSKWLAIVRAGLIAGLLFALIVAFIWVAQGIERNNITQQKLLQLSISHRDRFEAIALEMVSSEQNLKKVSTVLERQLQSMQKEILRLRNLASIENRGLVENNKSALDAHTNSINGLLSKVKILDKQIKDLPKKLKNVENKSAKNIRKLTDELNRYKQNLLQSDKKLQARLKELEESVTAINQSRRLVNRRLQEYDKRIFELEEANKISQ